MIHVEKVPYTIYTKRERSINKMEFKTDSVVLCHYSYMISMKDTKCRQRCIPNQRTYTLNNWTLIPIYRS